VRPSGPYVLCGRDDILKIEKEFENGANFWFFSVRSGHYHCRLCGLEARSFGLALYVAYACGRIRFSGLGEYGWGVASYDGLDRFLGSCSGLLYGAREQFKF
tara:strand:- start:6258 stop:6563 length:306 start_codon:yes stop_codon:yes gene_type:complete